MDGISAALGEAVRLISQRRHTAFTQIVALSLEVSLRLCCAAALDRSAARRAAGDRALSGPQAVIVALNALMGLPPVVVGLLVYLLLSRAGPLGQLGLLFTPTAMVIAQTILIAPIIAALSRQVVEDAWREYAEQLRSLGATPLHAALTLLWDTRFSLVTVVLAGFGRAAAEVGAVMIVGGNIDGVTRVMTTTIALETSKGDLPLALGLGHRAGRARPRAQRGGADRQGGRAAALRLTGMLPLALDDVSLRRAAAARSSTVSRSRSRRVRARSSSGPNGAGKSVLMRLCHGLLAPTSGAIVWRGSRNGERPRAQAMVFQRPVLLRRSALANVTLCAQARRRVARASAQLRAHDVLDAVGLGDVARPPARVLSGGEQQRLALARAWALRPGSAVPRRADRESRSGRDARGRDASSARSTRAARRS